MKLSPQSEAIINAMPEAILVVGKNKGRILDANEAFYRESGLAPEVLTDMSLIYLPQFTRTARHGLVGLYVKTLQGKNSNSTFRFRHAVANGQEKNIAASAFLIEIDEEKCVLFRFREEPLEQIPVDSVSLEDSGNSKSSQIFLQLSDEAWIEFRPNPSLAPRRADFKDRLEYLRHLGCTLFVHKASDSALKVYGEKSDGGTLPIPFSSMNFLSLFCKEDDALRFLDMLSSIGQLRANTLFLGGDGQVLDVDLSCQVLFGQKDDISALYCLIRNAEELKRYKKMINEARIEQDFFQQQPFIGLGQLMSSTPIKRPGVSDVEEELFRYVQQIHLVSCNDALTSLYGVSKGALLMQPMSSLFPDSSFAVQILKELFVTRQSSFAEYDGTSSELKQVLLFRAGFDNSDRLTKVFVAASAYTNGFQARHDNLRSQRAYTISI